MYCLGVPDGLIKIGWDLYALLEVLMPSHKIRRAKRIKNKEVTIQEATDKRVRALVRDYNLLFDLKKRVVFHDCADWSRCIPVKQFCKHVGKVMMSLPEERAVEILRMVCLERDEWGFKPLCWLKGDFADVLFRYRL